MNSVILLNFHISQLINSSSLYYSNHITKNSSHPKTFPLLIKPDLFIKIIEKNLTRYIKITRLSHSEHEYEHLSVHNKYTNI